MTTRPAGLRERKKQATRKALRDAALRLALQRGPEGVRVDDIAEAAGVSPRTYNNYFSSREQAIVATVTADRLGDSERHTASVLAASVAPAVRVALEQWIQPAATSPATGGLVVVTGSLPDLLRTALTPLTSALNAAEEPPRRGRYR